MLHLLEPLNPFAGHLRRSVLVLRTLRLALVLTVLMIPVYGVLLQRVDPGAFDPWWLRVCWTLISIALLAATFTSEWVRDHARGVLCTLLASLVIWFGIVAMINGLTAEMALGFTLTYFCVGIVFGLAYDRLTVLLGYLVIETGFAFGLVLATPTPETDPVIFIASLATTGLALLIGTYARIQDRAELDNRGRLMASAERLSGLGSWTYDLVTGERRWSEGMYRLVSVPVREGPPPTVSEYACPEFRSHLAERERQLLQGNRKTADDRYEIERADGERRAVRSIVQLLRSEDGTPSRLVGAVVDVTDQRAYVQGLERARAEAEGAAALKSAILANMSHEIRTPLTAMIGYAELLHDEIPPELHDLVEPIQSGGLRLMNTLHDVLELARMESEVKSLAPVFVDIAALAGTIGEARRETARAQGLAFSVRLPQHPLIVVADRSALARSLDHLLVNALKFTSTGSISLSVDASGNDARIRVSDTGQGIAPEFMPSLFEPFHQESTGTGRTHEGSGLGLSLTHRLITEMNGTIEAESEVGSGTTFTIRLPLAPSDIAPADEAAWISRAARSEVAPKTAPSAPEG